MSSPVEAGVYSLSVKAIEILRARVAQLLYERKLKPADLARELNLTQAWASGFLSGKKGTTFEAVDALATFFKVTHAELLDTRRLSLQENSATWWASAADGHAVQGEPQAGEVTSKMMREWLENEEVVELVSTFLRLSDAEREHLLVYAHNRRVGSSAGRKTGK